ncbi:TIGR01906 family membrane protein [Lapidilactobacillus bayanensis]|uniref:TIGR01906 family membrane protein n=1 Tax=Lapidilactobacillus bayanensis TaxID=2485998 RepID=UPI000F786AE7|nr:TIGR01906 family membrane protein [Lapidilactobacillus bayanensis]
MKADLKDGINWLAVTFFCISLAVVLTLLCSYLLFPVDAQIYQVRRLWPISAGALYHNFVQLMAYLQLPWISTLQLADFPVSKSGALHFADVKKLFILAWVILLITAPFAVRFLRRLKKQRQEYRLLHPAQIGFVIPLILAGIAALNFNQFFITFHEIFFRNQDWLFDPAKDPIILVLPEEFFMHCFILAFVLFELMMLMGWLKARRSLKLLQADH